MFFNFLGGRWGGGRALRFLTKKTKIFNMGESSFAVLVHNIKGKQSGFENVHVLLFHSKKNKT